MAGVNMRLLGKKTLDFSKLVASQTQMLIVSNAINTMNYREGTLVVRVHGTKDITGDASIQVMLVRTAPTEEDPATLFYQAEPTLLTVTIDADTSAPTGEAGTLLTGELPPNFGAYLGLAVMGVQASSTQTIKATISVDLTLKE